MIVHSLCAENLLKYRRLELKDLPGSGVIAISGDNESGKSSIGESLCFALFGRSFAVDVHNLDKLIRWGENRCSVELEFTARDAVRYRIVRMLDRDGNHSARLSRSDAPDAPIARGVEAVTEALYDILGYAYDEFIESFYLAQREITTPHPHSYAVKIMAGVAPLEYCRDEFGDDLGREEDAVQSARTKADEMEEQLAVLGFDEQRLRELEARREEFGLAANALDERATALAAAGEEFQEREPRLRAARSTRGTASGLRALFLLLALAGLGLWGLLSQAPDQPVAQQISALLSENVAGWSPQYLTWVLYAGAACAVLFVLFWIRVSILSGRIAELRGSGARLVEELAAMDQLEAGLPEAARPAAGGAARMAPDSRDHLARRLGEGSAVTQEVVNAVEREAAWLDAARESLRALSAEADRTLAEERVRQGEHNKLLGMKGAFEQQAADHQHRIQLRELADELLLGASRHLSYRFNHNLREKVSKTLPLFTGNRYEHLQIDEDLTVRAFSSEKRDFMDLDEISSGTQRQIMLALRLALSQELVDRVVKGSQFVFLDEPFAFFDQARTRSSLNVLPQLSDNIDQFWIVAQEFPDDVAFERSIHCDRGAESYPGKD